MIKLAIATIIGALYLCAVWFISRQMYRDCLYFYPKTSIILAFINCCIMLFGSFSITKKTTKWIKQNKSRMVIIFATIVCCLLMPFLFFKNGTVIDKNSIKKINCFGNTIQEYHYSDITKVKLGVQYGIQYTITFKSGEVIEVLSHEVISLNSFGNDKNIVKFDKLISEKAEKEIYWTTYLTPSNVRRFFKNDESLNYFDDIFNEYY